MSQGKTVERLRRKAKGPSIGSIMAASYHSRSACKRPARESAFFMMDADVPSFDWALAGEGGMAVRRQWILFLLLLALVISAGIGTANLMWERPPHVVAESRPGKRHLAGEQADRPPQPLEVSSIEGAGAR